MSDNVYMRERAPRLEAALTSPVCSKLSVWYSMGSIVSPLKQC